MSIAKDFASSIKDATKEKTSSYDTQATVTRIEGKTAWVHIPGGVTETPVQLTVNASEGDAVQVRVANGKAWITGNASAPPTDDTKANVAISDADTALKNSLAASKAAEIALDSANSAQNSAAIAQTKADEATTAANEAKGQAKIAHDAANNALTELSTVEDVVGTVTWAAEHSDQDMADYINSHLALTTYGLDLVLDNTSYRIHIGTHTADGEDGVYVIDEEGNVVSFFGKNIKFDADHAQYIGNNNAYIVFDPTGNGGQGSLIIGGSSIQMGSKSLEEILGKTLIYDHTYEYVRDSNNKPVSANFTAFLYRGGVDVKTEYSAENFTWYLKKEEKGTGEVTETLIGTGYTCSVNLSDCGYGAEVVGKFTLIDDADALTESGDNLTNAENENLSVRATGDAVRVRDLSVSSTIFPTDKLMVVGNEDEHLVGMETLQDYLNAHLDKQVLFDTTANWNSQLSLISKADTIYIYTDYKTDSQGRHVAGIKVGDGLAYLIDLPFTDAIATEHIEDNTRHITQAERDSWNNKVRCYYAGTEQLIFTTA